MLVGGVHRQDKFLDILRRQVHDEWSGDNIKREEGCQSVVMSGVIVSHI